jgi:hypothetical protein
VRQQSNAEESRSRASRVERALSAEKTSALPTNRSQHTDRPLNNSATHAVWEALPDERTIH